MMSTSPPTDTLGALRDDLRATSETLAHTLAQRHATRRALAEAEAALEYHRAAFRLGGLPAKTLQETADRVRVEEAAYLEDEPASAWATALAQHARCMTDADLADLAHAQAQIRHDTCRRLLASAVREAHDG